MELGVALPLNEHTLSMLDAAPAVEERGFESLWVGEHTHLPVETVHRYTSGRYGKGKTATGGRVPDMYKRFMDPFVNLTAAAALTSTVRLGTACCLVAEHEPIVLAKQIATLDLISGGRFELGAGYGWNPLEAANNGIDPTRRRAVLREKVRAMTALWTHETAGFDGEFVSFTESWAEPKPLQEPRPPVLLGAAGTARNLAEIVAWADGWLPVAAMSGERLLDDVALLRTMAADAGRPRPSVSVIDPIASFAGKHSHDEFVANLPAPGVLEAWADGGIDRAIVRIPAEDRDRFFLSLDVVAKLGDRLRS